MNRYAKIHEKMPREFVLLQGTGCKWARCTFCDYFHDVSAEPFTVNRSVLDQVSGCYGVLDVINSGSAAELDEATLEKIRSVILDKKIHTVWFEMHYMYRKQLKAFAKRFAPARVKFRCGIESFDPSVRKRFNKGIQSEVTVEDVARYFDGVCLLCCTQGDTRERILKDIALAKEHFEYCSVNVFNENSTAVKKDPQLIEWFVRDVYPRINEDPRIEVLLNNTDLGVG